MNRSLFTLIVPVVLLAGLTAAFAPLGGGSFDLAWHTIDGGGGTSTGGPFELTGTIAQPDAGPALTGGAFELAGGFWGAAGGPGSEPAVLTDFTVAFGTLISGDLTDLLVSDDQYIRTRSHFGFSSGEPNVSDLYVGAATNAVSPATLDLAIESRLNTPGGRVKVRLRNWTNNVLEQVHQYTQGTTEATEVISGVSALNRVRAGDGRIELSMRQSVVVVFSVNGFDSFFDYVDVSVND
jgi:hypothetical protein